MCLNNLLALNSNEIRNSRKSQKNLNDYNIKKENNKNQELNIKVGNNISNRKKNNKNFSNKNIQLKKGIDGKTYLGRKCYISNQNIIKVDVTKKNYNDYTNENSNQRKINKKKKKHYFDFDKDLKVKRPKHFRFQSLINNLNKNIFDSDKKLIIAKKESKKIIQKKKNDSSCIDFNFDSSYLSKRNENDKEKKIIFNDSKSNSSFSNISKSNSKNNKDDNKNNILKCQQYKMKHINSIHLGRYSNKIIDKNKAIIKIPAFSVVKPDKLISFEFNREYETRNRSYYMNNKDNINDDTNTKERKHLYQSTSEYKNKRGKIIFCCLWLNK